MEFEKCGIFLKHCYSVVKRNILSNVMYLIRRCKKKRPNQETLEMAYKKAYEVESKRWKDQPANIDHPFFTEDYRPSPLWEEYKQKFFERALKLDQETRRRS